MFVCLFAYLFVWVFHFFFNLKQHKIAQVCNAMHKCQLNDSRWWKQLVSMAPVKNRIEMKKTTK